MLLQHEVPDAGSWFGAFFKQLGTAAEELSLGVATATVVMCLLWLTVERCCTGWTIRHKAWFSFLAGTVVVCAAQAAEILHLGHPPGPHGDHNLLQEVAVALIYSCMAGGLPMFIMPPVMRRLPKATPKPNGGT
jgi:hypothetical protein